MDIRKLKQIKKIRKKGFLCAEGEGGGGVAAMVLRIFYKSPLLQLGLPVLGWAVLDLHIVEEEGRGRRRRRREKDNRRRRRKEEGRRRAGREW